MKYYTAPICLAALARLAQAFPTFLEHIEERDPADGSWPFPLTPPPFDAASQLVDVTGEHAFDPPGPTDQRGPCPGLNALANHHYLSHNGIVGIKESIDACMKVYGLGVDLAGFLGIYPAVVDGNLLTYSIGGPDPRVSTLGLLGTPQGLSGSHNKFEGDASPTRGDLYLTGNSWDLNIERFQKLYDAGKEKDDYGMQTLTNRRFAAKEESIANNPYFVSLPFAGIIAPAAAWAFIFRCMANKTAEQPDGYLNGEILKSFYGVSGEDGNFQYNRGHERIPDNWYTRNSADPYTITYLSLDDTISVLQYPDINSLGGNTGTPNSFTGVRPADITGGVFNAQTLLEGNNLFCYAMQLGIQQAPDFLSGLFTDVNAATDKLGTMLNRATNSLGCPKLNNIKKHAFDQYPGFTQKYDGYEGYGKRAGKLLGIL